LAGIFLVTPKKYSKVLPVSSHLPDLSTYRESISTLTLIFTGDVMLGRSVNSRIIKYDDPAWPFKNVSSFLKNADLTVINLESPFITGCEPTDTGMVFCADPRNVLGLVEAGVDIASIDNNHINNQGQKGISETISILKNNNIAPVGLKNQYFNTVNNTKLAILSFSDLPQMDEKEMVRQILDATESAELVITTFHWGNEYQSTPSSRQKYLAHLAIDNGSDLVVGHHPHWIQPEEMYRGKPIFYSLGNLVFDQMWSEETRLGQVVKFTYQGSLLVGKEIIFTKIYDYGQPSISDLK